MERIEYRNIVDKSEWLRGIWDDEPDKIQWPDKATGLPCLIVRGAVGALCGYVGVPKGHPWFGKDYDDVEVDVHGGLTFASPCQLGAEAEAICHKPAEGESDQVWWLGFDCAHLGDLCPTMRRIAHNHRDVYRPIAYVEQECCSLAKQVIAFTN